MKNLNLLIVLLFIASFAHAQTIQSRKIGNGKYEYWVKKNPNIKYEWNTDIGTITKVDECKIRIQASQKPNLVQVKEIPIFPTRTISVAQYGAKGNGVANDTKAIQNAVDKLYQLGGGTLIFEAGKKYLVNTVTIQEGIHYKGNNTTITRPPMQGKWLRTFTSDYKKTYKQDSKPMLISGLIFDGNYKNQGDYGGYQLEQAHLLFLCAGMDVQSTKETGRLKVFIESCRFQNAVADGISQYVNSDVTVRNCTADNVFRGGYVCTGGNSIAKVSNFKCIGSALRTGIAIEIDGAGYGSNLRTDIWLDSVQIANGYFGANCNTSSLLVTNSKLETTHINLYGPYSQMVFKNSLLTFGNDNEKIAGHNSIVFPSYVAFEDCDIVLNNVSEEGFGTAILVRNYVSGTEMPELNLLFKNCNFTTKGFSAKSKRKFGLVYYDDSTTRGRLKISMVNTTFSKDFAVNVGWIRYVQGASFSKSVVKPSPKDLILNTFNPRTENVYSKFGIE